MKYHNMCIVFFNRFSVDVKNEKNVAFHFDVRIDYGVGNELVRNSYTSSGWGVEERYLNGPYPFIRDNFFEMVILVHNSCYKVLNPPIDNLIFGVFLYFVLRILQTTL
jgi:hypothetical protein